MASLSFVSCSVQKRFVSNNIFSRTIATAVALNSPRLLLNKNEKHHHRHRRSCCCSDGNPKPFSTSSITLANIKNMKQQTFCFPLQQQKFSSNTTNQTTRFSSSSSGEGGNESKKENETISDTTTPLSEISNEDLELVLNETATPNEKSTSTDTLNINNIPGTSKGDKLYAILYTCNVCNTRSAKKFTQRAYHHGVVLVRCPNCQSLHLIADRLGFFTDKDEEGEGGNGWDIEMYIKQKMGQDANIRANSSSDEDGNVLELTLEDVVGESRMEELRREQQQQQQEDIDGEKDGKNK